MPTHLPNPSDTDDDDDDTLADALADAWIERAASDPILRRAALRAAGLLQEPSSVPEIARQCGLSESSIRSMVRMFRSRLAAEALRDAHLPPSIRRAASQYLSQS